MPGILVFAGSIRTGAFSIRTANAAAAELTRQGAQVTVVSLADFPLPIMDEDLEKNEGIPANVIALAKIVAAHDGLLIASPEYNASIPPLLKNTLDWLSRVRSDGTSPLKPFDKKTAALCSSSDGAFAGMRGLYHLRAVLMACGVQVLTPQCSISRASEAFDENGDLRDERQRRSMQTVCDALIGTTQALARRGDA